MSSLCQGNQLAVGLADEVLKLANTCVYYWLAGCVCYFLKLF